MSLFSNIIDFVILTNMMIKVGKRRNYYEFKT